MFSLLHVCSYIAAVVAFLFVTLSLASGLLYIAELVEEHSRLAKLVGQRTIYGIILLHILFCFVDRLPLHLTALGIFCHLVYLQNFSKTWPFISLTSLQFIASCILVILDHFAWFFYFADRAKEHTNSAASYRRPGRPGTSSWDYKYGSGGAKYAGLRELSFMDVATFFGVCVWLVPFFLFLSLSANDNVLPSLGEAPQIKTTSASDSGSPVNSHNPGLRINTSAAQRSSILKVALDPILSLIPRIGSGRFRSSRSQRDGIIASPVPSGPPSPILYAGPSSPGHFGASSSSSGLFGAQIPNYMNGYDPSNLSPQTPYASRFAEAQSMRHANSSPTSLRLPPGPKRSATSPAVPNFGGGGGLTGIGIGGSDENSAADGSPTKSFTSSAATTSGQQLSADPENYGVTIPRSTSPFAQAGAAGSSSSGLVSRRKGT